MSVYWRVKHSKMVRMLLDIYQVGLWCLHAFRTTHNVAAEFPFYPADPSIPFINSNSLSYCWWTKSCTIKDDDYPIIYRFITIPGGASTVPLKWPCFFHCSFDIPFDWPTSFPSPRLHRLCEVVDRFIEAPICGVDLEGFPHARNAKALIRYPWNENALEKTCILHIFWWFYVISYFVYPRYVYVMHILFGWWLVFMHVVTFCWVVGWDK